MAQRKTALYVRMAKSKSRLLNRNRAIKTPAVTDVFRCAGCSLHLFMFCLVFRKPLILILQMMIEDDRIRLETRSGDLRMQKCCYSCRQKTLNGQNCTVSVFFDTHKKKPQKKQAPFYWLGVCVHGKTTPLPGSRAVNQCFLELTCCVISYPCRIASFLKVFEDRPSQRSPDADYHCCCDRIKRVHQAAECQCHPQTDVRHFHRRTEPLGILNTRRLCKIKCKIISTAREGGKNGGKLAETSLVCNGKLPPTSQIWSYVHDNYGGAEFF